MNNFKILCPKCDQELTEKDFGENSKSLSNLQKIFKENEDKYIKKLETQLTLKLERENKIDKKLAIEEKINELNKKWQEKIDEIQKELSKKDAIISSNKSQFEADLNKNNLENSKIFNNEIKSLKDEINELKLKAKDYENEEKNHSKDISIAVEKNTNFLNEKWQQKIDKLSESNREKESKINSHESEKKSIILETTLDLNKKWQNEVDQLKEENEKLKHENDRFKIIRPKTMGENFENEFKSKLKEIFFYDEIEKITNTGKKADFKQKVINNDQKIGEIIYEIKSGENWDDKWINKFENDIANQKANYGILVAKSFRKKYNDVPFEKINGKNIFITDSLSFSFVGHIVRMLMIKEALILNQNSNKKFVEKFQKLEDWKNQKFNLIIQNALGSLKTIENQASKLENIKNNILENTKKIIDEIIVSISKEINDLFKIDSEDSIVSLTQKMNKTNEIIEPKLL